jgi:proto-oncogene tyrosine-protein kinase ROS
VRYETNPKNIYNISLTEHCIETEILKPITPSVPRIETNEQGLNYITWSKQQGNIWYLLQMQNLEIDQDWKMIKNSSDNTFVTSVLNTGNYTFRVRSENQNGVSEFTAASDVIDIDEIRSQALVYKSQHLTVMAVCLSFACLFIVIACSMLFSWKLKHIHKETKNHKGLEGFLNHENPIYGNPVSDEDLKEIPQIKRDQLSFLNFLGKGAFGEVYQGTMKNMHDLEQGIAIKMLRQDASDNDKEDFLKEAKIMWNFKHDHIVNLEAICLDVEANFLILELMEEGDLLRYLRNHRPKGEIHSLKLLDQVEMSLDVAKGTLFLFKLMIK